MPYAMVLKYKIIKARFLAKINFYAWSSALHQCVPGAFRALLN